MKTVLVVGPAASRDPDLVADLGDAGFQVVGGTARDKLVHDAIRLAPDLVVGHLGSVDDALFEACARLAEVAPHPVVLFTADPDVAKMERALAAGIHAYVVNGYGPDRLRSVLQLAAARFAHDRALRDALADVTRRFDERKLVDRAKAILMRARQLSEEDAFRALRTASMHSNRRVGQVSQQVIDAAHAADAVNRAGKLRMLGQRLVKLCMLRALDPQAADTAGRIAESVEQIDATITALGRSLSKATFGDLLDAVEAPWPGLRHQVTAAAAAPQDLAPDALLALDRAAEALLQAADRLTRQLETAGLVTTLHVINVSGRQRMWSQRCAKLALLALLFSGDVERQARADLEAAVAAFEQGLDHLRAIPLTNREIRGLLDEAVRAWSDLRQATGQLRDPGGVPALAAASETLLDGFERLTDQYERSMQVLMG